MPCERNNLSRDNLLNSSDNLATDEGGSSPRSDVIDSSDIVLIEKPAAPTKPTTASATTRDTITYETEKDIKKHSSPSSSTPLLYANNVQSYQHSQPINEQLQHKSAPVQFPDFYEDATVKDDEPLESVTVDDAKQDCMVVSITEDLKGDASSASMHTNPFFSSIGTTAIENVTARESGKGETPSHDNLNFSLLFIDIFR